MHHRNHTDIKDRTLSLRNGISDNGREFQWLEAADGRIVWAGTPPILEQNKNGKRGTGCGTPISETCK